MTRIGVIGSGNIGGTIGEAWRSAGHEVTFASRSPQPPRTVVIDATNDVGAERLNHADVYAESAPGARFARAFNTVGFEMFAEPAIGGEVADLFWCGPEDAGVEQLIADVGLRPVRVGDIDAIEVVDGVCRLWLTLVFRQGYPRRLAFRMLAD
jgi:8-hydroxy-5-deazaflavin:NADPH oxidoreductase